MKPTLNLLFALNCEAKPFIDYFKLHKRSNKPFPHFTAREDQLNYQLNLVVSGIGMTKMAAACGWLMAQPHLASSVWLNIGTAGHASIPVGDMVRIAACSDEQTERIHYPPSVVKWAGESATLISHQRANTDYQDAMAVDMEAAAFFEIAKQIVSSELVQSIKVISDSNKEDIEALTAQKISDLIADCVPVVMAYAEALLDSAAQIPTQTPDYDMQHLHCTTAQSHQFSDLQQKLQNVGFNTEMIQELIDDAKSMKSLLAQLRQAQLETAPNLSVLESV